MSSKRSPFPVIKDESRWAPFQDDVWVFSTGYTQEISRSRLISKFCSHFKDDLENKYFGEYGCFSELTICPIVLIDRKDGFTSWLTSRTFNHFNTLFQARIDKQKEGESKEDKEAMEEEKKKDDRSETLKFQRLAELMIGSLPARLKGAIVFRVNDARLEDITHLRDFLKGLHYCEFLDEMSMSHYQICRSGLKRGFCPARDFDPRVTVFEYDCEVVD